MKTFRHIPSLGSVFKVTEGCCYHQVIYDGKQIGDRYVMDEPGLPLNSAVLSCYCDLDMEILPVSEEFYLAKLKDVNQRLAHLRVN